MNWATQDVNLRTPRLQVRTFKEKDVPAIARAIHDPASWFGRAWNLDTLQKTEAMLRK